MRCMGHGSVHPLNIQARKSSSPVSNSVSNPLNLRAIQRRPCIHRTHYEPCPALTIRLELKSCLCFGTSLSLYPCPFLFPPKRSANSGWIEVSPFPNRCTYGLRSVDPPLLCGMGTANECRQSWKEAPLPALCVVGLGPVDGLLCEGPQARPSSWPSTACDLLRLTNEPRNRGIPYRAISS